MSQPLLAMQRGGPLLVRCLYIVDPLQKQLTHHEAGQVVSVLSLLLEDCLCLPQLLVDSSGPIKG